MKDCLWGGSVSDCLGIFCVVSLLEGSSGLLYLVLGDGAGIAGGGWLKDSGGGGLEKSGTPGG